MVADSTHSMNNCQMILCPRVVPDVFIASLLSQQWHSETRLMASKVCILVVMFDVRARFCYENIPARSPPIMKSVSIVG